MTALGLLMSGAGVVLIFAGIKGEDVRALVVDTITGKRQLGAKPAPAPPTGDPNGPGGALGEAGGRAATGTSSYTPFSPITAQLAAATASRGYSPTID